MADGGGGHIQAFRGFQKAALCDDAAEDAAKGQCHGYSLQNEINSI